MNYAIIELGESDCGKLKKKKTENRWKSDAYQYVC
jgi:hypothetical protein